MSFNFKNVFKVFDDGSEWLDWFLVSVFVPIVHLHWWSVKYLMMESGHDLLIVIIIWLLFTGEAAKWEKITYVGIAACSILAFVNLSKGHPHFDEPPVRRNFVFLALFMPTSPIIMEDLLLLIQHLLCLPNGNWLRGTLVTEYCALNRVQTSPNVRNMCEYLPCINVIYL